MPGAQHPGRGGPADDPADPVVEPLKELIRQLLINRGINADVRHKVNARGETVIGIILEKTPPY